MYLQFAVKAKAEYHIPVGSRPRSGVNQATQAKVSFSRNLDSLERVELAYAYYTSIGIASILFGTFDVNYVSGLKPREFKRVV